MRAQANGETNHRMRRFAPILAKTQTAYTVIEPIALRLREVQYPIAAS